ncbi:MAG TPA: class I SAM-dependent methyltransferase [Acidimicrobiales bacterium]|nr:class I SAM-dependent methyltransferase [Acidimicrobiales bacterium]
MDGAFGEPDDVSQLIVSQRRYYDLRAPDYGDPTRPADRKDPGLIDAAVMRELIDEFRPQGDVLELACGSGAFTRELVRHARSLTAVDGSPRMLERNREAVSAPHVEYVCADLFAWRPTRQYDAVFFGFWLSHVPPTLVEAFWALVRSCLRPGGRAAFVDEGPRARVFEASHTESSVPVARRTLSDGTTFDIVKVFWEPGRLQESLRDRGWHAHVRPVGDAFFYGVAEPPA